MSLEDARAIRLERDRVASAQRRMRAAREVAEYHEGAAAAERAKIATLARTWNLCPTCFESAEDCAGHSLDNARTGL